ncbi:hypothetical protein CACET_c25590 [Clostridium aceticum]|uniref:DUF5658 domain-containing protein n=1 Tax=Clostridium aceticum TaxID=84022 RepID=A0A0G3WF13_9CLOT|nr:DUF5658 family protein [Clostridium aceticum]AKL96004.1 hypothetical protein CACET_c25590 [Clostridium aceticum]
MTFIKNCSLESIKSKLLILYLLNVTDIIFTLLLLRTGLYIEINAFMASVVESPIASLLLKIILPAVLLIMIYFRIQKATAEQLKKSNLLISGAIAVYALINLSHLLWFAILPVLLDNPLFLPLLKKH